MENNQKSINDLPHRKEGWDGYTMEDLRYRRAYVAARRELEKERLFHNIGSLRKGASDKAGNVANRVISAVPLLQYGLMAWSMGSKVFRVIGKFRKKK